MPQIVSRGYVLVRGDKVSAVVSGPDAKSMQRRFGGRIVNAAGEPFRYAQQRQLRVLVNPAAFLERNPA
ncbi:MAG TPA: hypothetical protein VIT65_10720 [Microlunatus sp.]